MLQKVKASYASSREKDCSRIVLEKGNDQSLENQSNTSRDESSRSRNECNDKSTSRDNTDIRPSYDTEPMVEVPYTAEYNVFDVDTQHSRKPESINNTCVVEKFASQVGVSHDLTKLVTPHSWPQVRKSYFAKPYHVNLPVPFRNSPKHVSFQSPRESVGSNDIVHNYYLEKAKKNAQLHKDKALNTKPSVQQSARLPNTANGNKLKPKNFNQQPRNWPPFMSSRVSNRTINLAEPPRNQNLFLKSKDLACPACKKCIYSANHDECILKYLSKIPIGQKFSPNKSSTVYLKTTPSRSSLTWKPTGRMFTQVGLKWILIRKSVETYYNMNDSASPLGKN
nr:hypothetical protein [Tanacetum cinerariifolium]